jgi:hypothetical protein
MMEPEFNTGENNEKLIQSLAIALVTIIMVYLFIKIVFL